MKKIFALILMLLMTVSAVACGGTGGGNSGGTGGGNSGGAGNGDEGQYEYVLANFDEWSPSFTLLKIGKGFGRVSQNSETQYATEGKSAKLQPIGDYATNARPSMYVPTSSAKYKYSYKDFSQMKSITFDIYNAQSETKNVYVGLVYSEDGSVRDASTTYPLKSGWNNLTYLLEPALINLYQDITNCHGIYFEFDHTHVRGDSEQEMAQVPVYYLDNIVLHKSKTEIVLGKPDLEPNEVCDFEKIYQNRLMTAWSPSAAALPEVEVVLAQKYGIDATSGTRCLRLVTKPTADNKDLYPMIGLSEKMMNSIGMETYGDNAEFAFDIYNNSNKAKMFFLEFVPVGGNYLNTAKYNFTVQPHSWLNYKVSFASINSAHEDVNVTGNMGAFNILWREYAGEEQEFFIDNIRIIPNA